MNTLFHPKGRSGLLPTGTPMTKGSPKSNQVMEIASSSVSMFSVQKKAVSPVLVNTALVTGIPWSANSPDVVISSCIQRTRAMLSE